MPQDKTSNTIVGLFARRIHTSGPSPALLVKRAGEYQSLTWNEIARDVRRLAKSLVDYGVQPRDRIAQLSENRYEWIVTDLAIQCAQGIHVPLHAPLAAGQVAQQLDDSGAQIVFASTSDQVNKIESIADQLSTKTKVVSYEHVDARSLDCESIASFQSNLSGEQTDPIEQQAAQLLDGDSLATILYTSGTTGEPKGVMLNHRNLTSNAISVCDAFGMSEDDVRMSFLPLSHVFARTCDLYIWLASGGRIALAESRDTVLVDCAAVHPTMMNGVPYFFERVQRYLVEQGTADQDDSLIKLLGGRMRSCCSGGAALPDHVHEFFHARGVPLLQGYGLTESSPVITLSSPTAFKRGTVGRAIDDVEIRTAGDGEILARGPNIMVGFWNKPQATAEVIKDGWLYTGDIGEIDGDGYLKITGRKKELIVTATGKNVAPVFLESLLCREPLIDQVLVIGNGRKYLSALIVPNDSNLRQEVKKAQPHLENERELHSHPLVLQVVRDRIDAALSDVSHHEQVRRFVLLDRPFSIEQGELTPKLSLRRTVIEDHFREHIEEMYS